MNDIIEKIDIENGIYYFKNCEIYVLEDSTITLVYNLETIARWSFPDRKGIGLAVFLLCDYIRQNCDEIDKAMDKAWLYMHQFTKAITNQFNIEMNIINIDDCYKPHNDN